jgi:imidazole glycerol-phosphate synthase subunit HisF
MLKKRLIGVVTIKDGWAVQSFGYKRYLPLGKPECLVENLDRWGADEILIQVIDRSLAQQGPDFKLIDKLAKLGIATPLIYGGGIHSVESGIKAIQAGADRLLVDAILHLDPQVVTALSDRLGAQAIIASLPVRWHDGDLQWLNYLSKTESALTDSFTKLLTAGIVSEVMLLDWIHDGMPLGFDAALMENFPFSDIPLILFGGISDAQQISLLLSNPRVAAVAMGNFLNYQEHAIQKLKEALTALPLRPPTFESKYLSFANV